jgi:soluble lytic murein transglycosylase-like protein
MSFRRRLSAATTALIAALLALFPLVAVPKTAAAAAPKRAAHASEVLPSRTDEDKIYSLIRLCRPRRGTAFAHRAASLLVAESRQQGLPPLLCAAVAYAESHFDQGAGPCVGIMQVHRPSLREYTRKKMGNFAGLDPDEWDDNIRIGVRELGLHKRTHHSLRGALGRYNGCGPNGGYVDRVMDTYSRLRRTAPSDWRSSLSRGRELWR